MLYPVFPRITASGATPTGIQRRIFSESFPFVLRSLSKTFGPNSAGPGRELSIRNQSPKTATSESSTRPTPLPRSSSPTARDTSQGLDCGPPTSLSAALKRTSPRSFVYRYVSRCARLGLKPAWIPAQTLTRIWAPHTTCTETSPTICALRSPRLRAPLPSINTLRARNATKCCSAHSAPTVVSSRPATRACGRPWR